MRWFVFAILSLLQAADVVTTEIGVRTVAGFYELNPFMAFLAGQPPDLWRMIAVKLVIMGIILQLVRWSEGSWMMTAMMALSAAAYIAIVWNNIGVLT